MDEMYPDDGGVTLPGMPEDVYEALYEELEAFAEWDALYAPQIGGEG